MWARAATRQHGLFLFNRLLCLFHRYGGSLENHSQGAGSEMGLCPISPDYPGFTYFTQVWLCAVRQSVRHFLGRAYLSQNIIAGCRRGERGKMCPFKGTEGKKHLRSSGKKPQKWETGGAEPPGPEYRLSPLLGRRPRKTKVGVQLVRPHCTTILFIDHNYDGRGIYDNDL